MVVASWSPPLCCWQARSPWHLVAVPWGDAAQAELWTRSEPAGGQLGATPSGPWRVKAPAPGRGATSPGGWHN